MNSVADTEFTPALTGEADHFRRRLAAQGSAQDLGRAETTRKYSITFDVWSQGNGCAASNLVAKRSASGHAWRVLFEVSLAGMQRLREVEGNRYEEKAIRVVNQAGEKLEARTFLVKRKECRRGLWTGAKYVGHIVRGLRAHNLPEDYVAHVIDTAIATNSLVGVSANEQSRQIELCGSRTLPVGPGHVKLTLRPSLASDTCHGGREASRRKPTTRFPCYERRQGAMFGSC